jgi:hypothetical protein
MIVTCIHNKGANLGKPERGHFYSEKTVFDLKTGSAYPVLGMGLFETTLLVLVLDDTRSPSWLPAGLFEFDQQKVPDNWEFALVDGLAASGGAASNRWAAKWGYPELVRNASHSDGLMERDPAAIDVFFEELAKRGPTWWTPPQT